MKHLFLFFLFFIISCSSSQVNKETPPLSNNCEVNTDCNEYNFCIKNKCVDYINHNFKSIDELNELSVGKFIIMSDNKGDSTEDKRFKNMVDWSNEIGIKFIIGLGDHVKINWPNQFLNFLETNKFWFENFYPNIADGENEYYGSGQGDWGAGKKFLEFLNFSNKKNTNLRENGVEYYSKLKIVDVTVHLIQFHFPDTPSDADIAWPQNSRDYLINTLKSINKTKNDLVIVGGHSMSGRWYQYLKKDEFDVVMQKVDLGLSATTHLFGRYKIANHDNDATLFLNTGSITRPRFSKGEGFIVVFILDNPNRIVLQYIDPTKENLEFDTRFPMFIKDISGYLEEKIIEQ